eukprot:scaffold668674_cov41-Prasinocladus_malaysianus.AAC.1
MEPGVAPDAEDLLPESTQANAKAAADDDAILSRKATICKNTNTSELVRVVPGTYDTPGDASLTEVSSALHSLLETLPAMPTSATPL